MSRFFAIIFCVATSFLLHTACTSEKERGTDVYNDDFMFECDTLLGAYPDIVVKKLDSAIAVSGFNEKYYSLLLLKSKAKLFMSEYDSVKILLDSISEYFAKYSDEKKMYKILASVNNMRGNLYARRSVMDSAVIYFDKAYKSAKEAFLKERTVVWEDLGIFPTDRAEVLSGLNSSYAYAILVILNCDKLLAIFRSLSRGDTQIRTELIPDTYEYLQLQLQNPTKYFVGFDEVYIVDGTREVTVEEP